MASSVATAMIPQMRSRTTGLLRTLLVGLTAFLTVVDLFATQAILPALTRAYGTTPAAMSFAVNASTMGMAIAGLAMALFGRRIDRRFGIMVSLAALAVPTLLLGSMPGLAVFAGLRVVQGLFMATAFTLTLACLAETSTQQAAIAGARHRPALNANPEGQTASGLRPHLPLAPLVVAGLGPVIHVFLPR
jgi:MFS family permease